MISIDRISFEFAMNDEPFAHSLYADWDSFCRTCFENIVEECLSAYDKDRILHEIDKLDLDLGSIPQEEFYSEFPRRLREELLKVLPSLLLGQSDIEIAGLCMANEHVLRRLLLQTDNDAPLAHLYSIAMDQTFYVKDEKQRFMEIFLEMLPDVPVRFVHVTEEDEPLHSMAELLDSRSVHKIMEKESEEHAEVDIPPYWHYLYKWLIKYYPFNGLAVFGGKSDFIDHLHYRLLTFIHKRNNTFYLSKTELIAAFLLEVFGTAYYKEMLNAIYNMQPRNADGSPAHDGYYNRQLYSAFMQLSLLYSPMSIDDKADETTSKENTSSLLTDFRIKELYAILKDAEVENESKRKLLQTLIREKPQKLIEILCNLPRVEETASLTATYIPTEVLLDVVEKADAKQALLLSRTIDLLQKKQGRFAFLSNMTMSFTTALSEALLLFMQDNDTLGGRNLTEQEVIGKFLFHLYYVYTRKTDYNDHAEWKYLQDKVTNGLGLDGKETASISEDTISERLLSEYGSLNDSEVYHLMIMVLDKQPELFIKLSEKDTGTDFIKHISGIADRVMLRRIVTVLSSISGFENHTAFFISRLYGSDDTANLPLVMLTDDTLPKEVRKQLRKSNAEEDSGIAFVGNAGLCLLSPWFPRLFTLLGYLDEEKRNFKDTASRVRAVFLLQYLACLEKKNYHESELVFNRLLVALPAHIPLPKRIDLTDEEKQTTDDMLEGVKANWPKMDGTSVSGFRQSFIVRDGQLQQQDEKWLLTVESRVYDILLDAVPWAFRQIRFPWLKKYVQVFWHEKQEF